MKLTIRTFNDDYTAFTDNVISGISECYFDDNTIVFFDSKGKSKVLKLNKNPRIWVSEGKDENQENNL